MQKELRIKMGYPPAEAAEAAGSHHSSTLPPHLQQAADSLAGLEGMVGVPLTVGVCSGSTAQLSDNGQGGGGSLPDATEQAAADADLWPVAGSVHPTMYSLLPPPDSAVAAAANDPKLEVHQSCLDWNERAGWITGALHSTAAPHSTFKAKS